MILHSPRPAPLPLVVFADTTVCDTGHEHEITLISDGRTAYAYGPATDCGPVHRDGVTLSVDCNQPTAHGDTCTGRITVSLDAEGTWTADPTQRRLLGQYGQAVES